MSPNTEKDDAWMVRWALGDRSHVLSWDRLADIPAEALRHGRFTTLDGRVRIFLKYDGRYAVERWSSKNKPRQHPAKNFQSIRRYLRALRRSYEPREAHRGP